MSEGIEHTCLCLEYGCVVTHAMQAEDADLLHGRFSNLRRDLELGEFHRSIGYAGGEARGIYMF